MKKAIIITYPQQTFVGCLYGIDYDKLCKLAEFRASKGVVLKRFKTIEYKDKADLLAKLDKLKITSECEITLAMYEAEIKSHFGLSKENDYNIFLLIELARNWGIIDKQLEYDLTWEQGQELYSEFEKSTFDDSNMDYAECLYKFFESKQVEQKQEPSQELIDQATDLIVSMVSHEDFTGVAEIVANIPNEKFKRFLP